MIEPTPTPIEEARALAIALRGRLLDLAGRTDMSAFEIRESLLNLGEAMDGLCDRLKPTEEKSK